LLIDSSPPATTIAALPAGADRYSRIDRGLSCRRLPESRWQDTTHQNLIHIAGGNLSVCKCAGNRRRTEVRGRRAGKYALKSTYRSALGRNDDDVRETHFLILIKIF
jgi:hypothetical protein